MIRKWSYIIKKYDIKEVLHTLENVGAIKLVNHITKFGNTVQFYEPTNKKVGFTTGEKYIQYYKGSEYKYDRWFYRRAIYLVGGEVMVNTTVLNYILKQQKGL